VHRHVIDDVLKVSTNLKEFRYRARNNSYFLMFKAIAEALKMSRDILEYVYISGGNNFPAREPCDLSYTRTTRFPHLASSPKSHGYEHWSFQSD
jgi:hypothetical protein